MKIGIASIMGAIFGLAVGSFTSVAVFPIALTIFVSVGTGMLLNSIDRRYGLTEKLIETLETMGDEIKNMGNQSKTELYRGMGGFLRSQGLRIPNY